MNLKLFAARRFNTNRPCSTHLTCIKFPWNGRGDGNGERLGWAQINKSNKWIRSEGREFFLSFIYLFIFSSFSSSADSFPSYNNFTTVRNEHRLTAYTTPCGFSPVIEFLPVFKPLWRDAIFSKKWTRNFGRCLRSKLNIARISFDFMRLYMFGLSTFH